MKRMCKLNCCLLALAFFTVSFLSVSRTIASTDAQQKEETKERKVVAKVNGKPIYEDQLDADVNKSLKKWKKYGMKQQNPALTYKLQKKALNGVIEDELVIQAAQKTKVKDLDKKVNQKLQQMKQHHHVAGLR